MLVVNDEFKSWMRKKLSDRDYAERVMKVLVDNSDCTLLKVHPHAALPVKMVEDPEVMIGLIKGYDNVKDKEFLLAVFGRWEDFRSVSNAYIGALWGMYKPLSNEDFENLPQIYMVAFTKNESDQPLIKLRNRFQMEVNGVVTEDREYEEVKVNLVNTNVDSKLIKIIRGIINPIEENKTEEMAEEIDISEFEVVPAKYFEIDQIKAQRIRQQIKLQNRKKQKEKDQQDDHKDAKLENSTINDSEGNRDSREASSV